MLYTAAATHFALGLWALYQRRHFRYTVAEFTQLVLGLSVPVLLFSHFGAVRLTALLFDRAAAGLFHDPVHLLERADVQDLRPVCAADRGLDACLHRDFTSGCG